MIRFICIKRAYCILFFIKNHSSNHLHNRKHTKIKRKNNKTNKNLSGVKFLKEIIRKLTGNTMSYVTTVVWLGESGGGELVNEN